MSEPADNTGTERGHAIVHHLGLVGMSFILSFLIIPPLVPFDPEGAGGVAALFGIFLSHGIAAAVSLGLSKRTTRSCLLVCIIAFLPAGCFGLDAFHNWCYLNFEAVYDRFRDNVASPIPNSVENLRFVPLEEQINPDLMFRFDIAPKDLDTIITDLKMERVEPSALPNPRDFFRYPYYLPLAGDSFELFQGKDRYDEVLTIKTNPSHTHAIFRRESSGVYRDKRWETLPEELKQMEDEDLERLKRKHEDE